MVKKHIIAFFVLVVLALYNSGCGVFIGAHEMSKAEKIAMNPFPEEVISVRSIKASLNQYYGKSVVIGPMQISRNDQKDKLLFGEIVRPRKANHGKGMEMERDTATYIKICYAYLEKSNIDPIDLRDYDHIFVKGTVCEIGDILHYLRGVKEPAIIASDIIWTGHLSLFALPGQE